MQNSFKNMVSKWFADRNDAGRGCIHTALRKYFNLE